MNICVLGAISIEDRGDMSKIFLSHFFNSKNCLANHQILAEIENWTTDCKALIYWYSSVDADIKTLLTEWASSSSLNWMQWEGNTANGIQFAEFFLGEDPQNSCFIVSLPLLKPKLCPCLCVYTVSDLQLTNLHAVLQSEDLLLLLLQKRGEGFHMLERKL